MPLPLRTTSTVAVMTPAIARIRRGTRTGIPSLGWVSFSTGAAGSWEEEDGGAGGGAGSLLSELLSLEEEPELEPELAGRELEEAGGVVTEATGG